MRPAIILFAKAPLAGHVKTRLQDWLGVDATLALHEAFVLDTLDKLLTLGDFADALALNQHLDSGKAVRLLGWQPRHGGFLDEVEVLYRAWKAQQG